MFDVTPGNSPWNLIANFACGVMINSAAPDWMDWTILRAARRPSIDTSGNAAPIVNHWNSLRLSPLKYAFRCDPVRISPGHTVVTFTPSRSSSARIPSEKPTAANFAAQYGTRWGTDTLPPKEVMFAIRPSCRDCMYGSTARVGYTTPQNITSIDSW